MEPHTTMTLKLHFHPLASFCWKVLIALYENDTPFEPHIVDLGDAASRADFTKLWPIAKMPLLRDDARDATIPESSIIIEYLTQHYPGRTRLIPAGADLARQTRLRDRFFDLYVHEPMQKIVTDRLRPAGKNDPHGVEQAKTLLATAYGMIDQEMEAKTWAMGDAFSMADCAAAPALFYANKVQPFGAHKHVASYFDRLMQRPSFARTVEEAKPYFALFPG
jgi:glutathione S-transferase